MNSWSGTGHGQIVSDCPVLCLWMGIAGKLRSVDFVLWVKMERYIMAYIDAGTTYRPELGWTDLA